MKAKRSKSEAAALDTPSSSKTPKASKKKPAEDDADDSEDEDEQEDEQEDETEDEDEDEDEERTGQDAADDSDDEGDPSRLVHESLLKGGEKGNKGQSKEWKTKNPPSDESPAQRDARTVFVGNVAIEVVKSRVCLNGCFCFPVPHPLMPRPHGSPLRSNSNGTFSHSSPPPRSSPSASAPSPSRAPPLSFPPTTASQTRSLITSPANMTATVPRPGAMRTKTRRRQRQQNGSSPPRRRSASRSSSTTSTTRSTL